MTGEEKAIELAEKVLNQKSSYFSEVRAVQRSNSPIWDVHFLKNAAGGNSYTSVQVEVN